MENNNWQISIKGNGYSIQDTLIVYRFVGKRVEIITDIKTGKIETIENDGAVHDEKYTARFETREMRSIVDAFVKYAQDQGFRSQDESHNKGKLEATERHLTDMRTLLKLK